MKKRLLCLSLAIMMTTAQVVSVSASRTEEEVRAEQEATNNELNATYSQIDSLETQKEQIAAEINELDQDLVDVMVNINVLTSDIETKEVDIKKTNEDLKTAEANRDKQYEDMKLRIQYLYENGGSNAWFQMLMDSKDITDLLNKAENTQKMYDYDRASLTKYKETVTEVTELGEQLEAEKADLVGMKSEQEAQQADLEVKIEDKKTAEDDYEYQISVAQEQADQYAALIEEQNAEIQKIQEEQAAAAAAAAAEAARIAAEEEAARQAAAAQAAADAAAAENATEAAPVEEESTSDSTEGSSEDSSVAAGSVDEYGNVVDSTTSAEVSTPSASTSSGSGQAVVDYALQFVGNPYVWGGTSLTGGADCSGFVQSVYAHFGVSLPRTSETQMYAGTGVSYSEAQPGDLICYGGHIAIYIGDGQIVHASNSAPYPAGGIKVSSNAAYRSILAVRRVI